ncbi:MAG: deoxyribose-phosphate aldolase [Rhodoferax ferrireducens]|uniref:Deoxyribose-phosphate aldolase n=2 Tax=Pseudomonadota TaxID=1224 RepID=A0A1Y1QZD0_9GAMM|nr:MAG: deoxyribose-phosphate aldolase [Rhodoferax ferrireducens]OQX17251.1 MAG: deoxyribose-phosphate aldolase [Thiothrix lacustris]
MTNTSNPAPVSPHNLAESARTALACLDLTSLNKNDTEADIAKLCQRAQGPTGPVAAVCVWPRLAAFARAQLPTHIGVAAVANFPHGNTDVAAAVQDTKQIVQAGAQEVDVVLPYKALMAGDEAAVTQLLTAVRQACPGLVLKVILETGELQTPVLIARASQLALAAGADFLKTSTGKTPVNATPEAARVMLSAIAASPAAKDHVGFKASGGIRTVLEAMVYESLVQQILGEQALNAKRFRIGASSLLNDIEAVLNPSAAPVQAPASGY